MPQTSILQARWGSGSRGCTIRAQDPLLLCWDERLVGLQGTPCRRLISPAVARTSSLFRRYFENANRAGGVHYPLQRQAISYRRRRRAWLSLKKSGRLPHAEAHSSLPQVRGARNVTAFIAQRLGLTSWLQFPKIPTGLRPVVAAWPRRGRRAFPATAPVSPPIRLLHFHGDADEIRGALHAELALDD